MTDTTDWKTLFDKAQETHETDFDWCQGYSAYNSDFEWDEHKPYMWKLGFLYGYLHQKGGLKPQG